jgi:hypothetical protein
MYNNKGLEKSIPNYEKNSLFSPAERSFLGVLDNLIQSELSGQYRIIGKVRLADILRVKNDSNKQNWQKAFNKIQSKHVDFVAIDPVTLEVRIVIELDDSTHNNMNRRQRDSFVDKALNSAGIPIMHFKAQESYNKKILLDSLRNTITLNNSATQMNLKDMSQK